MNPSDKQELESAIFGKSIALKDGRSVFNADEAREFALEYAESHPGLTEQEILTVGMDLKFFPSEKDIRAPAESSGHDRDEEEDEEIEQGEDTNVSTHNVVKFFLKHTDLLGKSESTQNRLRVILPILWKRLEAGEQPDSHSLMSAVKDDGIPIKKSDIGNDIAQIRVLHGFVTGKLPERHALKHLSGGLTRRYAAAIQQGGEEQSDKISRKSSDGKPKKNTKKRAKKEAKPARKNARKAKRIAREVELSPAIAVATPAPAKGFKGALKVLDAKIKEHQDALEALQAKRQKLVDLQTEVDAILGTLE